MVNLARWGDLRLVVFDDEASWELILGGSLMLRSSPIIKGNALTYIGGSRGVGEDRLGKYVSYNIDGEAQSVRASYVIKAYLDEPVVTSSIVFKVNVDRGVGSEDNVDTASFNAQVFLDRFFGYTPYNWIRPTFIKSGGFTGDVVLGSFGMFIDSKTLSTVVASALEPRAPQLLRLSSGGVGFRAILGLSGSIGRIPEGYTLSSILVYGSSPNEALLRWGRWIRAIYGRSKASIEANLDFINSLQYWTDTGGMYWYRTLPGMNYAQTMVEIKRYMDENHIGVRYYQVDSWWYPKSVEDGGALEYREVPELGMDLASLSKALGPIISLHIRYLSKDSPYAQRYPAKIAKNASCITQPEAFFEDLLRELKAKGVYSIKHDWLTTIRQRCSEVYMTEVGALERYLDSLLNTAKKYGILVELCMPDMYHYFIGAKHDSALMIRTSPDYGAALPKYLLLYYNAYVAQLAIQLGYAPFFDVMVTTDGHAYADLLARSIFYSPIGIGDAIDKDPYWRRGVNVGLLRRFLSPQWVVLRPSEPARLIDEMYINDPYVDPIPLVALTRSGDIAVLALFNVNRDLDEVCYTIDVERLGIGPGRHTALYDTSAGILATGSLKVCVRKAQPHVVLVFNALRPKLIGLTKYAIPPTSIVKISEQYLDSGYRADVELVEPGELAVYSPTKPSSIEVNGRAMPFSFDEALRLVKVTVPEPKFTIFVKP